MVFSEKCFFRIAMVCSGPNTNLTRCKTILHQIGCECAWLAAHACCVLPVVASRLKKEQKQGHTQAEQGTTDTCTMVFDNTVSW